MEKRTKLAVVTGAGSGIGRAAALSFAKNGHPLALLDKRPVLLQNVEREATALGSSATSYVIDVASKCALRAVAEQVSVQHPFALVTAAGITKEGMIEDTSLDDWDLIIRTNLTGTFLTVQAFLPAMIANGGGVIVTIGSISAVSVGAGGGCAAYEASKAGVVQFTRALAVEHAKDGIRANCVSPGRIHTNLGLHSRELLAAEYTSRRHVRDVARRYAPLRVAGTPEDVAAAVVYLCSDEAGFVTGANLVIDGGYSLL